MKANLTRICVASWTIYSLALAGCGPNATQKAVQAPQQTAPVIAPAPPESPPASVLPDHFYSLVDGYEYAYEPVLSTNDQNAGQRATEMVMIRYFGVRGKKYQIATGHSPQVVVMDCAMPCQAARVRTFYGAQLVDKKYVRVGGGTILQLALADALLGKLKPFKNKAGKYIFFDEQNQFKTFDALELDAQDANPKEAETEPGSGTE